MNALYLIGAPGVGKTSVMRELLKACGEGEAVKRPFAHTIYPGGVWLGEERGTFSGTDTLSMSVQPLVLDYLKNMRPKRVLAEGDRLANNRFFESVRRMGFKLRVVYLNANLEIMQERRGERGSNQNVTWLKGRESKALNLAQQWSTMWLETDTRTPSELAAHLIELYPDYVKLDQK